MLIQTVATVSYLPLAKTLSNSIQKYMPGTRFSVLITDIRSKSRNDFQEYLGPNTEILSCEDLQLDFIEKMRDYYSVLEFNSACKILSLYYQTVHRKETECLFLDPDIILQRDLGELIQAADSDILIFPHSLSPFPADKCMPNDFEITISGHINGGFLYLRPTARSMEALSWLFEKTKYSWFVAPKYGMYADQQWLSSLPYYFSDCTRVGLEKGANVAYWNLHERPLTYREGQYWVDQEPIWYFHFSGFSIPSHGKLTTNTARKFDPHSEQVIGRLCTAYENELLNNQLNEKNGAITFCNLPLEKRIEKARKHWGSQIELLDFWSFTV